MRPDKDIEQEELRTKGWRFHFRSDSLALNFVATVAGPDTRKNERLQTAELLAEWLKRAGLLSKPLIEVSEESLLGARELREAIARVTQARVADANVNAADVEIINQFASHRPSPSLLAADGRSLKEAGATSVWHLFAEIANDAIGLFGTALGGRIRKCASPRCPIYFVDHSRGNNRRWCSKSPCADQYAARQYRARKKAEA